MASQQSVEQQRPSHPSDHFLVLLDVEFDHRSGTVVGRSPVRPALFAVETKVIRPSLVFAMLDFMSGYVTGRPAGPTIDMRMQMLGPAPTTGHLDLMVQPLRVGKRIVVSQGSARDGDGREFARATTTFMNMDSWSSTYPSPEDMVEPTFDDMLPIRIRDERTIELVPTDRLLNGAIGTVQGGVQSLLAELCAQHAFGDRTPMMAIDIEARFLSAQREWPMVATAERLPDDRGAIRCDVAITDHTRQNLATHVTLTMVPAR
ncbi:MAG: PaaI family thioesterase [Acidimicrobiia bacterium]